MNQKPTFPEGTRIFIVMFYDDGLDVDIPEKAFFSYEDAMSYKYSSDCPEYYTLRELYVE